jgi:UDP-N-acetylglucosamine 2-epimerase (non-hydrolysing)
MAEICFIVGARPNFMKVAPVYRALEMLLPERSLYLVHTGQHYHPEMSDVLVTELGLPIPDRSLGVGSGTHARQTARVLVGVEEVLVARRPALVVVAGDVNSTLAAALAAAKLEVPIAHIESGLRSFDSIPEEHNRKLTDHLSTILLAHSASAVSNLEREGIEPDSVDLTGNTMIDSLLQHVEAARSRRPWEKHGLERGMYGLVTLHRPGLVDDSVQLRAATAALVGLAESFPLVFPVHPRTKERLTALELEQDLNRHGVTTVAPLSYLDFLGLEAEAHFVLTDSGGLQEETSALGVRCFTLRSATERPITVELGTNTVLGSAPERIVEIPALLEQARPFRPIPLWDGRAGERSARVILRFLDATERGGRTGLRTAEHEPQQARSLKAP